MNNSCTVNSNKTNLMSKGYTHINLPIFCDSSANKNIGCMDDIDIGQITKFGIAYTGYDPASDAITSWSDFVKKVSNMFDEIKQKLDVFGSNTKSISWSGGSVDKLEIKTGEYVTLTPGTIIAKMNDDTTKNISVNAASYINVSGGYVGQINGGKFPIYANGVGTMTISVIYDGRISSEKFDITVVPGIVEVTGISLSQQTMGLTVGGSNGNLTAYISPTNASNLNVDWSIGNSNVATLGTQRTTSGQNLVIVPKAEGQTTIRATAAGDTSKYIECTLTVSAPSPTYELKSVSIDPSLTNISESSKTATLTANITDANTSGVSYSWSIQSSTNGTGLTLSNATSKTATVTWNNTSTSSTTVTIKCTASTNSNSVSNTVNITCAGKTQPTAQYKWATTTINITDTTEQYKNKIANAWNSSNSYWTSKPSQITIPQTPVSGEYYYVLIYKAEFKGVQIKPISDESQSLGFNQTDKAIIPAGSEYAATFVEYSDAKISKLKASNGLCNLYWVA